MADAKDIKDKESTRSYSAGRNLPSRRHYREGERLSWSGLDRATPAYGAGYWSSPFSLMRRIAEDMDRMFGDFGVSASQASLWSPQVETFRRGDDLVVRADLPGMNRENVNVEIEDNTLILSGERQDESKEEKDDYYRSERRYGQFYRAIQLPENVDPNTCNAQYRDGVLEVTLRLPKQSEKQKKRIDIR